MRCDLRKTKQKKNPNVCQVSFPADNQFQRGKPNLTTKLSPEPDFLAWLCGLMVVPRGYNLKIQYKLPILETHL